MSGKINSDENLKIYWDTICDLEKNKNKIRQEYIDQLKKEYTEYRNLYSSGRTVGVSASKWIEHETKLENCEKDLKKMFSDAWNQAFFKWLLQYNIVHDVAFRFNKGNGQTGHVPPEILYAIIERGFGVKLADDTEKRIREAWEKAKNTTG